MNRIKNFKFFNSGLRFHVRMPDAPIQIIHLWKQKVHTIKKPGLMVEPGLFYYFIKKDYAIVPLFLRLFLCIFLKVASFDNYQLFRLDVPVESGIDLLRRQRLYGFVDLIIKLHIPV